MVFNRSVRLKSPSLRSVISPHLSSLLLYSIHSLLLLPFIHSALSALFALFDYFQTEFHSASLHCILFSNSLVRYVRFVRCVHSVGGSFARLLHFVQSSRSLHNVFFIQLLFGGGLVIQSTSFASLSTSPSFLRPLFPSLLLFSLEGGGRVNVVNMPPPP